MQVIPIYLSRDSQEDVAVQLLLKQRFFSWFDSFDIYDEQKHPVFSVEGKLAWGHKLSVRNSEGDEIAVLKERVLTFLPQFEIYVGNRLCGVIKKEFTFFKPSYVLDCNDWRIEGDFFGWDYRVVDRLGSIVLEISKQLLNWTDTYCLTIPNPANTLMALMIVLAIDAANCKN